MATLTKSDLLKRDNVQKFVDRVNTKREFREKTNNGRILESTSRFKINDGPVSNNLNADFLATWLTTSSPRDKLLIEVREKGKALTFIPFTIFYKDKDFGGTAPKAGGQGTERQENGLINIINENTIIVKDMTISTFGNVKVKSANKKEGLSQIGKEPYIDIVIVSADGKEYGISCKGTQAPSLAGGGIGGLKVIVPDLMPKVYKAVENFLKQKLKLKQGSVVTFETVPDIFIQIPDKYVRSIIEGIPKMGGPITHMYIGPMDVSGRVTGNKLMLNGGQFYSIDEYMRKIPKFFFRLRKRDLDTEKSGMMKIEFNEKTADGFPKLFKGSTNNKNLSRIVIIDEPSSTSKSKGAVLKI